MEIANLQAMMPSKALMNPKLQTQKLQHIIDQAIMIERSLASWYSSLPLAWYPVRVSTNESFPESIITAGVYKQLCDVYPSISIAGTFNKYRFSLLRLKLVILNCLSQQPKTLTTLRKQADLMNNIQILADDVCASVPFHLGDRTEPGWLGDKSVHYPCVPGQELPEGQHQMAQGMGGWQLLEPLKGLLIIGVKLRTGQREWIGGQMMRIANIYNFDC